MLCLFMFPFLDVGCPNGLNSFCCTTGQYLPIQQFTFPYDDFRSTAPNNKGILQLSLLFDSVFHRLFDTTITHAQMIDISSPEK